MKDEGRATGSLDSVHDRTPQRPQRRPGGVAGHPMAIRTTAAGSGGAVPAHLCCPRSRHQQLPAADRASERRQLPRRRRILAHHPARRRRVPSGRISDAAICRRSSARHLPRQDAPSRRDARALIATEACRSAANGAEFRARIVEEVGLELEIIDRETEATLATGCTPLLDPNADAVLLFDIGGGSSELVRLDRSPPTRRGRHCRRSGPGCRCRSAW